MAAYYNEIDPYAAQWLRNLISAGHIAPGDVDERDIRDVRPSDLAGYRQCHFFAGIGVWSYALRRAGWPDYRPVWTGSCPCQPFSAAGRGDGFADERHLWPHWFHLISVAQPPVVFGEQVASKDANSWIDLVQDDLEAVGYGVGAIPFPAAGVGAPHVRDRLYWVADAEGISSGTGLRDSRTTGNAWLGIAIAGDGGAIRGLEYADGRFEREAGSLQPSGQHGLLPQGGGALRQGDRWLGHNGGPELDRPSPTNGLWGDADWLLCRDGKWRPVEPGTFPLAHGAASRLGRLRAYGNAIVLQAAEAIIASYLEAGQEERAALVRDSCVKDDLEAMLG